MVPYNQVLGIASSNVPAYSNGNDDFFSAERHYVHGIFTGYKWQCVEYARRWLLLRKTCIFRNIGSASDAWHELSNIERVTDGKKIPLVAHSNGSSVLPKKDSLLIYPRSRDLPFGHIAIITEVGRDYIRIAEQNYKFHRWSGNYARQIQLVLKDGGYYMRDYYKISGWMEISGNEQLQPLDELSVEVIRMQLQQV
jgi:trypanothione synthetase/amidase